MTWGDPALSDLLASGYLGLLILMWLGLVLGAPRWGRNWVLSPKIISKDSNGPLVTICIPARNEEHNIAVCVQAALSSTWPNLEVVLVDDLSEDGTAEAARAAAGDDPRFRVVQGSPCQAGWAGKPWACARAAAEARGEYLVFVDADVAVSPEIVGTLVSLIEERGLGLVSVFGTWKLSSFWERAVIPAVGWLIRGAVDLDRVNDPGRAEAFANGQLIAVSREAYESLGGHAVVRDQILEDVRLAEAFKRHGIRTEMWVAPWGFRVRLYRGLREILDGYSKNLYEGMGRKPMVGLGAVLFIFVGTVIPFLALLAGGIARLGLGWRIPDWRWLLGLTVICLLQIGFRLRIELRDGRSGKDAWMHPLGNVILVWILLRSVFGVRASWKGRRFLDGRAVTDE